MSVETSRKSQPGEGDPDDGQRRFAFRSADSAADQVDPDDDPGDLNADDLDADDRDEPQPTFTRVADGAVGSVPDPSDPTLNETDDVPVVPAQAVAPVTSVPAAGMPTGSGVPPFSSVAAVDTSQPLLGDAIGLRASWHQAQARFVDDPRTAVIDAAELVEHTAQTLIGALQQRQRQLRTQWDDNGTGAGAGGARELSDTERLRHLMQDYRSLFNQLCRP